MGVSPVKSIITLLMPYLRLKKKQSELTLTILNEMPVTGRVMTPKLLMKLSTKVDKFVELNYSKRRTNTSDKVKIFLESRGFLYPVETDPKGEI